jgi:hypothetical protein
MACRRIRAGWLTLWTALLWAGVGTAIADEEPRPDASGAGVPLEFVPAAVRDHVRQTLERPTITARGPEETFACCPAQYHWLLDHPDRAGLGWRRLGARCVEISDRGDGRFGWADADGSDISWTTVYRDARMRVWYAEGKVRVGAVLPLVSLRAVVVLHYSQHGDGPGRTVMQHQAELFLHTESRAVALAARLFGASAPRLGQQYVGQLEMFYSALAWYMDQHPDSVETLLAAGPVIGGAPVLERPALSGTRPSRHGEPNP